MAKGEKGKRRGLRFVLKAAVLGVGAVIAIAIAGDDELRAKVVSRIQGSGGPDGHQEI